MHPPRGVLRMLHIPAAVGVRPCVIHSRHNDSSKVKLATIRCFLGSLQDLAGTPDLPPTTPFSYLTARVREGCSMGRRHPHRS